VNKNHKDAMPGTKPFRNLSFANLIQELSGLIYLFFPEMPDFFLLLRQISVSFSELANKDPW
jgi:hypothetical protein